MRINVANVCRRLARVMHEAAAIDYTAPSHRGLHARGPRALSFQQPRMGSSQVACISPAPGRMPEDGL